MFFSSSQSLRLVTFFAATAFALPKSEVLEARLFSNATNKNLVFDARMPAGTKPEDFDNPDKSLFLTDGAKGQNLTWAQIIKIPKVKPTLFDPEGKEAAIEVSLSDGAIFRPDPKRPGESTNRRADLYVNISTPTSTPIGGTDVVGLKTLHFSLQNNPARPLNYSHNYGLSWMQSSDYAREQWWLRTGTILNSSVTSKQMLQFMGDDEHVPMFAAPFIEGWHNFGVMMNFDKNTTQVLYSTGQDPLKKVTEPFDDDLSGGGGYHFGVYKRATDSDHNDGNYGMTTGYEESNIDESIIYASIFMEDNAAAEPSLIPNDKTKYTPPSSS